MVDNLRRKEEEAAKMAAGMVAHMRSIQQEEVRGSHANRSAYQVATDAGERWTMHLGDCVESIRDVGTGTVGYTIFSPPFASLYTYSDSPRDMGNCASHEEFYRHFRYLIPELLRVTMPGRLLSFHCMNLPTSKARDGYIGITDFRGILIRACQEAGWIYHSEVVIWKDPVTAMQRTKALGLLHKQLKKDSAMSRQGIPDYLVTMRKPGENPRPIAHSAEEFPVTLWQRYASPVWDDINPSDTLQYRSVREHKDERHICPLQLEVIRRAMFMWTRPDDLILSPFAGIGSEGYIALGGRTMAGEYLTAPRRFFGMELKDSYYKQACANLRAAEKRGGAQLSLFASPQANDEPEFESEDVPRRWRCDLAVPH